ncbi:MAG: hypothetical protein LBP61_10285 [Desulfovibrio sp.]|jgi:phosphoglycerate dehydrogenase-like enzyme|nr:hypothetical protein [Desulfovibrio sp.]
MKSVVLYIDKISEPMEELAIKSFPDTLQLKFLYPKNGQKGSLTEAHYILDTHAQVTKDTIDASPNLKMIQRTGVGYDNVDVEYAASKNIPVSVTLGTNASSVAELVVLYMLTLFRNIIILDRQSKEGIWDNWKYRHKSFELFGKTVGIIGGGFIGREVMKRLKPFGVSLVYHDVNRLSPQLEEELGVEYREKNALLVLSDVVSLHVPWSENNRWLIGTDELALMKKTAILINTSRGPVVNQNALVDAIRRGSIAGAGLDVFDPEPFHKDSDILKFDNIITTPHVGAATKDNFSRAYVFCAKNILNMEQGIKAENIVNMT